MGEVARLSEARRVSEDPARDRSQTFDAFFEDEKDGLLRALAVITGSRAEAEDIAQEAFTSVFERWREVREMENPTGYLYRSAMNTFRSGRRRAGRPHRAAGGRAPPPDVFEAIEDRDVALPSSSPRASGIRARRRARCSASKHRPCMRSRTRHARRSRE